MTFPAISTVESQRLSLVPVATAHLDDLFEINGDDDVTRFLPYATWTSLEDGRAWLSRMATLAVAGTGQQLVLVRRMDGKVIGTMLLFKYDQGSGRLELGYALGRRYWHQGFMREAVAAACAHAFAAMGIRRIEAEVNPANTMSCALLSKIGFVLEGTHRKRWVGKGAAYDTNFYGLLAEDWSHRTAGS
jgi:ribosomal-protein-alanine N-acetyltransferase